MTPYSILGHFGFPWISTFTLLCDTEPPLIFFVSVTFLESFRGRLQGASNYVKANTFVQGLILTTLTHEIRLFEFSCTPMGPQARFEKGACAKSILRPLTHFWLLG